MVSHTVSIAVRERGKIRAALLFEIFIHVGYSYLLLFMPRRGLLDLLVLSMQEFESIQLVNSNFASWDIQWVLFLGWELMWNNIGPALVGRGVTLGLPQTLPRRGKAKSCY